MLEQIRQLPQPVRYWVAFSGGLDSTVLLNVLAAFRACLRAPLAAMHVDHGLQAASSEWAKHCAAECDRLGVELVSYRVDAKPRTGESPEAAARRARYTALESDLGQGAMLLTAHHLDDQAETLLLQLMRGAGVEGLAGMPLLRERPFGWHARPMLNLRRDAIHAWAVAQGLSWVDDPSNAAMDADRNYLRHEVVPAMQARWPAAISNIANSAQHCAEAAAIVRDQAERDLHAAQSEDGLRLRVDALCRLSPVRGRNLLRAWMRARRLPPLPQRRLIESARQLCDARGDAAVKVDLGANSLRRFNGEVWVVPEPLPRPDARRRAWQGEDLVLGANLGYLRRYRASGGIADTAWRPGAVEVGYRQPGLRCQPAGRQGSRDFKRLAQDCGLPPWLRDITPVIYIDGQVAAVANCCVCEPFAAPPGDTGWRIAWHPQGQAVARDETGV